MTKTQAEVLGVWLDRQLITLDMTRKELSEATGVPINAIYRLGQKKAISDQTASDLFSRLGTTTGKVLEDTDVEAEVEKEEDLPVRGKDQEGSILKMIRAVRTLSEMGIGPDEYSQMTSIIQKLKAIP